MRSSRAKSRRVVAATVVAVVVLTTTNSLAATPSPNAVFEGVTPVRVFDTRDGLGGHSGKLGAAETATFVIAGTNGIPADATAVTLNVTALNASKQTHLTVWPAGAPQPNASNLNPSSSLPAPNLVTVKLGSGGAISVYNNSGAVDVFGDAVGYYRDHNHDDRYYPKAQVDTALAARDTTISSLQTTVSSLAATVSSLQGQPTATGSVLDLQESTQTNSFPTTFNHTGERRPITPPQGLTVTVDSTVNAGSLRVRLNAYMDCTYNPAGNVVMLDAKIAAVVNGTESEPRLRTGLGGPVDFTWDIPVSGTGPFTVTFVLWTDVPDGGGSLSHAGCLVDQGHVKARLFR